MTRAVVSRAVAALAAAMFAVAALAAEPALTVVAGGKTATHSAASLLASPAAVAVTVAQDPVYRRKMTYQAVPAAALLAGIAPGASVRLVAADGSATTLPAELLLASGEQSARAYVAIEPPDAPWPPLRAGDAATAGPFYLVWLRPELGRIVGEQWPHAVARIEEAAPLAQRFPALVPASSLAADASIRRGFVAAQKHCLVCHSLNLAGDAAIGPDLNVPFNPTEYMRLDALRRLIRDPQSLHRWPAAKMPGFGPAVLSDRDLNDLLAYLRHMANRKVAPPK